VTDPVVVVVVAGGLAMAGAGAAALVVRPAARLAPRVRPYIVTARNRARGVGDLRSLTPRPPGTATGGPVGWLLGPMARSATERLGRLVDRRDDDVVELALRQAGFARVTPADYRARVAARTLAFGATGAGFGVVVVRSPAATLGLALCGVIFGAARARGRIDRARRERTEQMRLELYTVNQLLAMHVRTGAGPIQAVQRLVDHGSGAVIDELAEILAAVRRGTAERTAFRRAAELTPEPAAARTYRLFAAGAERGVDLAGGLRALSEDLRDARRDEIRTSATKRRAAMLVPTIAVLAPVMLLFIAAPLPSIVFGSR
jgi:Flp pilus assembly protein TadB